MLTWCSATCGHQTPEAPCVTECKITPKLRHCFLGGGGGAGGHPPVLSAARCCWGGIMATPWSIMVLHGGLSRDYLGALHFQ